jgi:hypothetical protein
MLKFLLILSIAAYLIYKVGSLFFRAGVASQHRNRNSRNVNGNADQSKNSKEFKGGEYIDYEEIK